MKADVDNALSDVSGDPTPKPPHDGNAGGEVGAVGARKRLSPGAAVNFPGDSLFEKLARVVCAANCLPRKELFEAWEVARRARRRLKGGRVVDLACGHGLVAWCMLLIDDRSPTALCVDVKEVPSRAKLAAAIEAQWPRLVGRVRFQKGKLEDVILEAGDVVVSAHACGLLTDRVLSAAIAANVDVAVLPCCHVVDMHHPLVAWMDPALAVDVDRAARLRDAGYVVRTQHIPEAITPKNRLLIARATR